MARRTDYRRALLRAVNGFLEGSPDSIARAHRVIKRCHQRLLDRLLTMDEVIWGPLADWLTDSLFYEDRDYLTDLRALLSGESRRTQRIYVSYDFMAVPIP